MKLRLFLMLAFVGATLSASAATNLAQGKNAYSSTGTASLAVDGNTGTRLETSQGLDNQWFYVDLESVQSIDHLAITWEGAYAKHFKIHVANEITDVMSAALADDDDTNNFTTGWSSVSEFNDTMSGFPYEQTIALSNVEARYVAIELIERGTVYGFSFWEFAVYDEAQDAPVLTSISLSASKTKGSVKDTYTLQLATYDQFGKNYQLTAEENASKQWICDEGVTVTDVNLTAQARGSYKVKCKIGDVESNEITIDVVADGENLAKGKTATATTEYEANNGPDKAVDGLDTMWITPEPDGSTDHVYDAIMVVDLGDVMPVNCIHLWWEGATSADYTITFSTDGVNFSDPVPSFTMTGGAGMVARNDWLMQDESINARYVKFHSTKAATQYGTKLREFEVYSNSSSALKAVKLSSDYDCLHVGDDSFTFTATGVNQFGQEMSIASLVGAWNCDNATIVDGVLKAEEEGTYEVSYLVDGITSNTVTVYVVDATNKVNVAAAEASKASSVTTGETGDSTGASAVIDGNNGSLWGIAEPAGSVDHTYDAELIIDLGGDTEINCARVSFEGANSCQYTLSAAPSSDKDNFTVFSSYDRPAKQEFRKDWHPGTASKVRYVKFKSTKSSTGYGMKIYEIELYNANGQTSSVSNIAAAASAIVLKGGIVYLPATAVSAEVYSLTGALVNRSTAATVDLSTLGRGVYLVRATLADGSQLSAKVVR